MLEGNRVYGLFFFNYGWIGCFVFVSIFSGLLYMDYLEYLYVREQMIFKINNIFETLIKNELKRRFLP